MAKAKRDEEKRESWGAAVRSHDTIRTPQEHTDSHQGARKVTC